VTVLVAVVLIVVVIVICSERERYVVVRPSVCLSVAVLTDFGTNRKLICDFLVVINTNLPPILHRFRDIALERSKILYLATPLQFNPPTEVFPWDDFHENFIERSQVTNKHCRKLQSPE